MHTLSSLSWEVLAWDAHKVNTKRELYMCWQEAAPTGLTSFYITTIKKYKSKLMT